MERCRERERTIVEPFMNPGIVFGAGVGNESLERGALRRMNTP